LESILDQIRKDPRITIPELARKLSVSGKTIKRDLTRLKETGRLNRVGPDKGGRWEVAE
jgi:ATP-dependent DNA helicase RecG